MDCLLRIFPFDLLYRYISELYNGAALHGNLETLALLSAVFGAYFCCFVRTKLSSFYDENSVNIFYDGPFRMNVPGVKFNNRNWPHIVRTLRLSLCLCMILFPIINIVAGSIVADVWET